MRRPSQGVGLAAAGALVVAAAAGVIVHGTVGPNDLLHPNIAAWSVKCLPSRQIQAVDPIAAHGQPVSAHMHTFYGQAGITPDTTPADLRAATSNYCPVTTDDPANPGTMLTDNTAQWTPTVYTDPAKTTRLAGGYMLVYYRNHYVDPATVQPFPQDLSMIAGDAHATGPQQGGNVTWDCITEPGGLERTAATPTIPATCPIHGSDGVSLYQLRALIVFPDCLLADAFTNPANYLPNFTTAMTYATVQPGAQWATCPDGYTPIPSVEMAIHYPLAQFPSDGTTYQLSGATLASDDVDMGGGMFTGDNGATMHADYMSGWTDAELADLVTNCYQNPVPPTHRNCGAFGRHNAAGGP